jgi:tRNA (cmo5U34)-methyltransferase
MILSHRGLLRPAAADGVLSAPGEAAISDFPFAEYAKHADDFDPHIRNSIRGVDDLRDDCVAFSRYFVQSGTTVVDIGCSAGTLLRRTRDALEPSRPRVMYVGIDVQPYDDWHARRASNVRFEVRDARSFAFENVSLAYSLFTLQFIEKRDRPNVLRQICDGLVEGGALILGEKAYANDAEFHDMLRSVQYDFKRRSFTAEEIFDKERMLRGQMNPWTEEEWLNALHEAGFKVNRLWHNHLFVAWVARKDTSRRSTIIPVRRRIERLNDRGLVTNPGMATIHPRREIIFIQDRVKRGRLIGRA